MVIMIYDGINRKTVEIETRLSFAAAFSSPYYGIPERTSTFHFPKKQEKNGRA